MSFEEVHPRSSCHLLVAAANKGTAFTSEERQKLHLRGLLPPKVETIDDQLARALAQCRAFDTPIAKYIYLSSLQERNERLFYRVLLENLVEMLPIVYTPTVGEVCLKFSQNFRAAQGMYFGLDDQGEMREMMNNWNEEVDIVVVTDGSRILGLGDLGTNGMGIPIGKLSLYVVGGGFHPSRALPVQMDFGTNNEEFLSDPLYLGARHPRITDEERYLTLMDEFMRSLFEKWPRAVVQFEDFSNDHAFSLLDRYRGQYRCFNDDIQGTGAVILSGYINCLKIQRIHPRDVRLVFYGAGSAGVGVADMIVSWFVEHGLSLSEARQRFWFVDSRGLVTMDRGDKLEEHKIRFAREDNEGEQIKELVKVIEKVKPNALIGLSGQKGSFDRKVLEEMCLHCERPVIMALSNPTSKSECTAEEAIEMTKGKVIFASGSPFSPVEYEGRRIIPGQGNNMFIFPGLGFGAFLAQSSVVSDGMIISSAKTLSSFVSDEDIAADRIYPSLLHIRDISALIATNVILQSNLEGLSKERHEDKGDLLTWVKSQMFYPDY